MQADPNLTRIGTTLFWIFAFIVMTALVVGTYSDLPQRSTRTLLQWGLLYFWTLVLPLAWALQLRQRGRAGGGTLELRQVAARYLILGYGAALLAISVVRASLP